MREPVTAVSLQDERRQGVQDAPDRHQDAGRQRHVHEDGGRQAKSFSSPGIWSRPSAGRRSISETRRSSASTARRSMRIEIRRGQFIAQPREGQRRVADDGARRGAGRLRRDRRPNLEAAIRTDEGDRDRRPERVRQVRHQPAVGPGQRAQRQREGRHGVWHQDARQLHPRARRVQITGRHGAGRPVRRAGEGSGRSIAGRTCSSSGRSTSTASRSRATP